MTEYFKGISEFFSTIADVMDLMFSDGEIYAYIGYAAGLATVSAFAIQTIRILKGKNVSGLSSYMYTMYSLSLICWFAYGVFIDSWVMAIANFITFLFTFVILLLILYYDEEDKIERYRRDPLTYIFNKKYYEECVPQKIAESTLQNQPFSIVVGKIDNLEEIYEQMGGKYRNRALKYAAKTLEKALRDSDFIARIDDNLFAIYLSNTDEKIAKRVAERVLESINSVEVKNSSRSIKLQMSFGICSSAEKDELNGLTEKAVKAMNEITAQSRVKIKAYAKEEKVKKKETKKENKKEKVKKEIVKEEPLKKEIIKEEKKKDKKETAQAEKTK